MDIYITLRAIYYMLLKLVLEKNDWPDGQWHDISTTVEEALGQLQERESNMEAIIIERQNLENDNIRLHDRIADLAEKCDDLTHERNELQRKLNERTKGKLVKMHLQLTDTGAIPNRKIPAIKELRNLTEIGLADAKHATEAAYDRPYIEVPIHEGDYRRLKDELECWKRIPKKKRKTN